MPSTSSKQRRAMQAAAHGNSTLGIPPKVGREFVKADKAVKRAGKQFNLKPEGKKGRKVKV